MATVDTITTAFTFLNGTLKNDTAFMGLVTGVFQDIAPDKQLPDYCIIGVQSPGVDTLGSGGVRILSQPMMTVKIVGPQADMANISAAYQRADTLLRLVRNDPTTGIFACYRTGPLYVPEPRLVNGEPWVNLGGFYRIVNGN